MTIFPYAVPPKDSIILNRWDGPVDYIDSYRIDVPAAGALSVDELATALLAADSPKWVKALSQLRDTLVGCFGLKTGLNDECPGYPKARYQPGDAIGFFPVIDRSESEIVMALDDRHLLFRVSVRMQHMADTGQASAWLTTIVQFHNIGGRLYFLPVKPFHRLIVRQALKRFLKQRQNPG